MCGIMGIIEKSREVDVTILNKMQKALRHRGPDDSGFEIFNLKRDDNQMKNIGLAFDRLSIRDLSMAGHQPMFNCNKDILIAFNGEIYNSEELRQSLIDRGYKFKGHSDTEVLLYMYECIGLEETLTQLDGMYGICIVDYRQQCLYLVRDKIGEKPIYLYEVEDLFLFASEYKAFYCHPQFKAELNEDTVDEYFLFNNVAGNDTLLKNVRMLAPGTYMKIDDWGKKNMSTYWKIPQYSPNKLSREENKKKLDNLLRLSVKRRLISDVPVGLQLSGGVDSSYLAFIAKDYLKNTLHTFGIVFKDDIEYNEEKYMDYVNEKFNFISHKYEYDPDRFFKTWLETTFALEYPMNHPGTQGLLFLNKKAKEHVTVMLCGEGADEVLGGYYQIPIAAAMKRRKIKYVSKLVLKRMASLIFPEYKEGVQISHLEQDVCISLRQTMGTRDFNKVRPKGHRAHSISEVYERRRNLFSYFAGKDPVRNHMNYDYISILNDLLIRADKVSMISSMEVRVPFLMPELLEFAATIPTEFLVRPGLDWDGYRTKWLLKDLAEDVFGHAFVYRQKMGFPVPLTGMMKKSPSKEYIEEVILPGIKKRNVIDYSFIKKKWNEVLNDTQNEERNQGVLWACFSFEIWAQMYLDGNPSEYEHVDF